MNNKIIYGIVLLAIVFIILGITFAFIELKCLGIMLENSEYVGALFALSGVFLFFAALLYQIKEYRLQVVELKKSVEAQTKSSEALDEQKKILLEQNINNILFGMIDSFNLFKVRNDSQAMINKWYEECYSILIIRWRELSYNQSLDHLSFNTQFAKDIKELISKHLENYNYHYELKKYVQFAYNILYLIDINLSNISRNIFTPFFLSQLNSKEIALIYLSNLVDHGMPIYTNLKWDYHTTLEIIDMIKDKNLPRDFRDIDCNILMAEFNKLRQQ